MHNQNFPSKPSYIAGVIFLLAMLIGTGGIIQHLGNLNHPVSSGPEPLMPGPNLAAFIGTLQTIKPSGKIEVRDNQANVMKFHIIDKTAIYQNDRQLTIEQLGRGQQVVVYFSPQSRQVIRLLRLY